MSDKVNVGQPSVYATRVCYLRLCSATFKHRRKNQLFCTPECRKSQHAMEAEVGRVVVSIMEGRDEHTSHKNRSLEEIAKTFRVHEDVPGT